MTKTTWRLGVVVALTVLVLPISIAVAPGQWSVLTRLALLIVGGCVLIGLVERAWRAAAPAGRSAFDPVKILPPGGARAPAALSSLDRRLRLASLHAGDAHHYVRPLVAEIAADRLELRRGLRLDATDPAELDRVRQVLGPLLWDLARPDRRRPDDPLGPGLTEACLRSAIDDLEAL